MLTSRVLLAWAALSVLSVPLGCKTKAATTPPTTPVPELASMPEGVTRIEELPFALDTAGGRPTKVIGYYRSHVACPACPMGAKCEPCPPEGHHFGATKSNQSTLLVVDFVGAEPELLPDRLYVLEGDLVGQKIAGERCVGCIHRLRATRVHLLREGAPLPVGKSAEANQGPWLADVPGVLRVFAQNASVSKTTDRKAIESVVRGAMAIPEAPARGTRPLSRAELLDRIDHLAQLSTTPEGIRERAQLARDILRRPVDNENPRSAFGGGVERSVGLLNEAAMLAMLGVIAYLGKSAHDSSSVEKGSELYAIIATMPLPVYANSGGMTDGRAERERLVNELKQALGEGEGGLWSKIRHDVPFVRNPAP